MKTRSTFGRCAFRPGGRAVNGVAVRTDRNDVRQLAAKGQVARNVNALGGVITEIGRPVLGVEDGKDKVPDLANRDPVPLWLNLAAGWRYCCKISFGLQ